MLDSPPKTAAPKSAEVKTRAASTHRRTRRRKKPNAIKQDWISSMSNAESSPATYRTTTKETADMSEDDEARRRFLQRLQPIAASSRQYRS